LFVLPHDIGCLTERFASLPSTSTKRVDKSSLEILSSFGSDHPHRSTCESPTVSAPGAATPRSSAATATPARRTSWSASPRNSKPTSTKVPASSSVSHAPSSSLYSRPSPPPRHRGQAAQRRHSRRAHFPRLRPPPQARPSESTPPTCALFPALRIFAGADCARRRLRRLNDGKKERMLELQRW